MKTTLALCLALLSAACQGTRKLTDPVLEIRGPDTSELGVATDYGLVFLGRSARSGPVEVTAWFGDGPSVELAVVEPLGGGLFTAEPEIKLPRVPITFQTPAPGTELIIVGRRGRERWQATVKVRRDPKIDGILLTIPGDIDGDESQIGAGVYRVDDDKRDLKHLVGLVSGRVELAAADGSVRSYLTVIGPEQMWRLVTSKRDWPHKRKFVYRADVL